MIKTITLTVLSVLNILFCIAFIVLMSNKCEQYNIQSGYKQSLRDTIINIDTILPSPIIIQLPRQAAPEPIIIYVDSTGGRISRAEIDTFKHEKANLYRDSIEDDNLTLYYESTVKGKLLNHALDYKLKIPKLITKTIEIPKPYAVPVSAFFLNGGLGGNVNQFSSVTVGLQFVSRKAWALGYEYDILQNTHHVKLGVKLFQLKSKK
jgi:hypothetical protein